MRLHPRRLRISGLALAGVVPVVLLAAGHLRVNFDSASAPRGVYLLLPAEVRRGEVVLVCLPAPLAELGRRQGYLAAGGCPGGAAPVVKRIVAVGGDVVEVSDRGLAVGGRALSGTARLRRDHLGRPVLRIPTGAYRLAPGELWLLSRYVPHSWDSRYFGGVPAEGIVGRVVPLVLFDPPRGDR